MTQETTRECPLCPPWVVRCVHRPEGLNLVLIKNARVKEPACVGTCWWPPRRWIIATNYGYEPCTRYEGCPRTMSVDGRGVATFTSFAKARAAFEQHERELIEGASA